MPYEGGALDGPVDLSQLPFTSAGADPDGDAIVSTWHRLSRRALDQAVDRLAHNYRELGLRPGDRVASLMPNRVDLAIHYLACFRAGLIVTPLNYRYMPPEIDHALRVSEASVIVAHHERADDLRASELAGSVPLGTIWHSRPDGGDGPDLERLIASGPTTGARGDHDPDAPAALFFTSGSTGPAKGVTHSRSSLGWMVASAAAGFELTGDDAFLPGSSMSHLGSFLWTFAALSVGAKVVVAHTFDSEEILGLLRSERPTVMAMIPAALVAVVRDHGATAQDFASLRLCRAGADKVSAELDREFAHLTGFPIDEGYGMSEVGLATLNPPSGEIRDGSVGKVVAGVSISVRDDEHQEVPAGEVGRVWINTPGRTVGYWRDPDATAAVLRDGWLDSGDLMRVDGDGYFWFFGRKKQVIVTTARTSARTRSRTRWTSTPPWRSRARSGSTTRSTARTSGPTSRSARVWRARPVRSSSDGHATASATRRPTRSCSSTTSRSTPPGRSIGTGSSRWPRTTSTRTD
jgi:acyl-CoA synthetase (AMP-forming)/AMP-acid ligase II